jgi:uncharacterized protein (DUF58 family)
VTSTGRAVAISGIVLLALGALTNYPELFALGIAAIVVMLAAAAWMLLRPEIVAVRRIDPPRVAEGESARGVLTLTNVSRRRSPPVLAEEVVGRGHVTVPLPSLPPGGSHATEYSLPPVPRGVYRVGPLTIGHTDPLRLLRTSRGGSAHSLLWVHPTIHRVAPVPTGQSRDLEGPTTASSPQGGIAFHGLRPYIIGDDLRLVHWKSTARTGKLMVRQNAIPNEPRIILVLDTSAEPYTTESFEDAARTAASLAIAGARSAHPVELHTTAGARASVERLGADETPLLDELASAEVSADDPGLSILPTLVTPDDGASLTVVTGHAPSQQLNVVSSVRQRFQNVCVVQLGDKYPGGSGRPLPGVTVLSARTSSEFAITWNRRMSR